MQRISKCEHVYNGQQLKAGESFEVVDQKHVIVLLALGAIEPEEGELGYVAPGGAVQTTAPRTARRAGAARR